MGYNVIQEGVTANIISTESTPSPEKTDTGMIMVALAVLGIMATLIFGGRK